MTVFALSGRCLSRDRPLGIDSVEPPGELIRRHRQQPCDDTMVAREGEHVVQREIRDESVVEGGLRRTASAAAVAELQVDRVDLLGSDT